MQLCHQKIVFVGPLLLLTACSFVKLAPQARDIFVAPSIHALSSCVELGKTNVSVWGKAGDLQSQETVEKQLNILARNSAAEMGGNAVAPDSAIIDGHRTYRVYNCAARMNY